MIFDSFGAKFNRMEIENVKPPVVLADSEHIFVQSNDFIRAKYKDNMTFWEFMIFGKMCTMIAHEDEDFKEYTIYIKDLIGLLGITDGGGVYKYVLEAASRLLDKRVIVSYKDREEDRLAGLEAGANYYLTKSSFHDESLLEAVRDLIGESN